MAVGIVGRSRRLPAATRSAASWGVIPPGSVRVGRLRYGTDSSAPWLVRLVAVATVSSERAASVSRSSHSGPTMTSLLRSTTSRPAVAVKAALQERTKPWLVAWRSTTT